MVGVCRGERRRKWREGPDGEACTFVGVDWYVPFPAQAWHDWVRGNTIFTSSAKKKDESRIIESGGRVIYI